MQHIRLVNTRLSVQKNLAPGNDVNNRICFFNMLNIKTNKMKYLLLLVALTTQLVSYGQKVKSDKSSTKFFSSAMLEDITATTTKGVSVINLETGEIAFRIPIQSFEFEKSLMQEHFNEKYLESDTYPYATFTGKITNWQQGIDMPNAMAKGVMKIHGVEKNIQVEGSITSAKKLKIKAVFPVKVAEYGIEVPSLMFQKIAEVVEVTVEYEYPTHEN